MDKDLAREAVAKLMAGVVVTALLLFVPAGSLGWWNAWLLLGTLFVPMALAGAIMLLRAPDLIRKRLRARERQEGQRLVIVLSGLMFVVAFALAGLGARWGWPTFPRPVCLIAAAAFLAGYALFGEVLRENEFLSRAVEVQESQHVVDTGLYGIVRHPMYAATLVMFLSMPVVLGSPLSLVVMLTYLPIISLRMRSEERMLAEGLEGYGDYLRRVRWRVIPHVW